MHVTLISWNLREQLEWTTQANKYVCLAPVLHWTRHSMAVWASPVVQSSSLVQYSVQPSSSVWQMYSPKHFLWTINLQTSVQKNFGPKESGGLRKYQIYHTDVLAARIEKIQTPKQTCRSIDTTWHFTKVLMSIPLSMWSWKTDYQNSRILFSFFFLIQNSWLVSGLLEAPQGWGGW